MSEDEPLLAVRGLEKHYPIRSGLLRRVTGHVRAVDGVSFDIHRGETLGLVGESGCGKSTTAEAILDLESPTGGEVRFDGEPVSARSGDDERAFRRRAQIVFQDPGSAFDPRMTVGESIREPLSIQGLDDADRAAAIVQDLLERVGMSAADADRYPSEFSAGQTQRLALARSLVLDPELLIADEPVSALDVSIQAEILDLLSTLQTDLDLTILLISHDIGVVREICDRVGVMYLGELVEIGPTGEVMDSPQHPYTEALLESVPEPDPRTAEESVALSGDVPDPVDPPSGCSFHPRCPKVIPPAEYTFEEGVFPRLLDLRMALEDGDIDPARFDSPDAIRSSFDLPTTLADETAEAVIVDVTRSIVDGDVASARDRLAGEFGTICERRDPRLRETDAGHLAMCHLHSNG